MHINLWTNSTGYNSIGSLGQYNSCSQVYDVMVDGAKIFNTENGLRIKTWQVILLAIILFSNSCGSKWKLFSQFWSLTT